MARRRAWAVGTAAIVCGAALLGPAAASGESQPTIPAGVLSPSAAASAAATETRGASVRAEDLVADMTIAEQARSVVMGHIPSTDPQELTAYMSQGLGGFILMGANIPQTDAELTAVVGAVTSTGEVPPLVAVDQEGGLVSRVFDEYAASTTLKSQPVSATSAAFLARGSLVAQAGIGVNFGTVADVPADPSSFIHGRALGIDPASAADRVAAATASQEQFVASTLKHFPGHGAAPGDSHHAIPTTTKPLEEWRRTDAVPFEAGIDAGASLLMFGHLAYTDVDPAPASLSARWHQIAREELGFDGVIVTDDLGMLESSGVPEYADPVANAVAAITAGSDLVLLIAGSTPDTAGQAAAGIAAAVESGALPAERLADAATRVMTLRVQSNAASAVWTPCPECDPAG
ncbi:glycoside hydrolase family 3 N-terminal domain-containing protein [Microbacterium sp. 3J1]|uniref:glycoside hydrolase family 3 N-terminal domain-containing protein n=1 Tax=Microbacterium sp. 3J1 TaxID=861269 RepID=UPI000A9D2E46|nr:glycoside hydrolase family 3 N-terminal domain-containing protein [Microbacterium sp. 3J1]